jgi:hypothetical protein
VRKIFDGFFENSFFLSLSQHCAYDITACDPLTALSPLLLLLQFEFLSFSSKLVQLSSLTANATLSAFHISLLLLSILYYSFSQSLLRDLSSLFFFFFFQFRSLFHIFNFHLQNLTVILFWIFLFLFFK